MADAALTKTARANAVRVSHSTLYYRKKQPEKDWMLKIEIEEVLREHPSYGHRRIAMALGHKDERRVLRVMRLFGIKPYRRRGRKYQRKKRISVIYANLLLLTFPQYEGHIWAADFTEIWWRGMKFYLATGIDLFTREIGVAIARHKGTALTMAALQDALFNHPRPRIFHSDNGSEYRASAYVAVLEELGILISRTHPGCPWENGYQESFYNQLKVDLGDPSRFTTLGELIAEIYRTIHYYNTERIHSALKMPPREFARQTGSATMRPTV